MSAQLILAGSLALLGAGIHGIGGELLVVRALSPKDLPPSRFGGPRTTKAMIHATWHLTTVGFLALGVALLVAGAALSGDEATGIGLVAAGMSTGFAAVVVALGALDAKSPWGLLRHPAPLLLTVTAALAWGGAL
jgi:hypothetical protein